MIIDHNFHAMIIVIIYEILVFMDEIFIHTFFMTPTKHPLNVERADEEEDGEGPVLDAHHDDVHGCEVVPPEVQVKIIKGVEIVKIFKIGGLNHHIAPPQTLSKIQVMSPGFGQLEMGDTEDRDHLDSMYSVLDLEAVASQSCKT